MARFKHYLGQPTELKTSVGKIPFGLGGISDDLPEDVSKFLRETTMVHSPHMLREVDKDGKPLGSPSAPVAQNAGTGGAGTGSENLAEEQRKELEKLNMSGLLKLAEEKKIDIPAGAKKADIIDLLMKAPEAQPPVQP